MNEFNDGNSNLIKDKKETMENFQGIYKLYEESKLYNALNTLIFLNKQKVVQTKTNIKAKISITTLLFRVHRNLFRFVTQI